MVNVIVLLKLIMNDINKTLNINRAFPYFQFLIPNQKVKIFISIKKLRSQNIGIKIMNPPKLWSKNIKSFFKPQLRPTDKDWRVEPGGKRTPGWWRETVEFKVVWQGSPRMNEIDCKPCSFYVHIWYVI